MTKTESIPPITVQSDTLTQAFLACSEKQITTTKQNWIQKKTYTYCDIGDLKICEITRKGRFKGKLPSTEYDSTVN